MKMLPPLVGVALLGLASVAALAAATSSSERPDTVPAGLVHYVPPEFPEWARANSICRGSATIAVSWDARGMPTDAVTLDASSPEFGAATCAAAMQWRADPAMRPERIYSFQFALSGIVICYQKDASTLAVEAKANFKRRLLTREDLDAEPRALATPMPQFAGDTSGVADRGRVVVEFFVDETGRGRAPSVVEASSPEFVEPTLATMREWRFETPRRNGRPVVFGESWSIEFKRPG